MTKLPVTNEVTYYAKKPDGSMVIVGHSYEEMSAYWGERLLDKHKIEPLRMGLYPFAWAKQENKPLKAFPEYYEYFGNQTDESTKGVH
jgi:hypothetical protein